MRLVLDASPLILLCGIGLEWILPTLADLIDVPRGVAEEIRVQKDDPAAVAVKSCAWLRIVDVAVPDSIKAWDLGKGEAEVVAHAAANPGVRPMLDDAEGKACCLAHGLQPIGTGGVLVLAKQAALITSVSDVLDQLRAHGMWISESVSDTIKTLAGEC